MISLIASCPSFVADLSSSTYYSLNFMYRSKSLAPLARLLNIAADPDYDRILPPSIFSIWAFQSEITQMILSMGCCRCEMADPPSDYILTATD